MTLDELLSLDDNTKIDHIIKNLDDDNGFWSDVVIPTIHSNESLHLACMRMAESGHHYLSALNATRMTDNVLKQDIIDFLRLKDES